MSEAKSGYILQWTLYIGQHGDEVTDLCGNHVLVRQLMAQHIGKGHELYMESYYTSPAVANELANDENGVCGAVSSQRRRMPKALRKTKLPLARVNQCKPVPCLMTKWSDRDVCFHQGCRKEFEGTSRGFHPLDNVLNLLL